jgi:hypothetical protein
MNDLQVGEQVYVSHQCEAKTKEPTIIYTVVNPCDPTDMRRITGEPVGYYVRLRRVGAPDTVYAEGYHAENVRRYTPQ